VQGELAKLSSAGPAGWKIAATSQAGQRHIGVKGPLAGRLLRECVYESGATIPFGGNHMRVAEPEFAFRFGQTLWPREAPYDVEQVLAAVATLHAAIEIPDSRYTDFARVGEAQLIADNACARSFVLGPAAPDSWRASDLARHLVKGTVAGKLEREGAGLNVLGDPRTALAWLVNEVRGLGLPLEKGHLVTTGTCMEPLEIEAGDSVAADFGALGCAEVRFGA
jgi:2-keto-4-pentenoate hydratase